MKTAWRSLVYCEKHDQYFYEGLDLTHKNCEARAVFSAQRRGRQKQ